MPLAFLSAHSDQETIAKTEEITSYGYILKGSGPIVLSASIRMALRPARSDARVSQLEKRFSSAFQSSAAGMSIPNMADEPIIVDCNLAFSRITGHSRDEVGGHPFVKFGLFADPEERGGILDTLRTEKWIQSMPVLLRRKDRTRIQVVFSVVQVEIDGV